MTLCASLNLCIHVFTKPLGDSKQLTFIISLNSKICPWTLIIYMSDHLSLSSLLILLNIFHISSYSSYSSAHSDTFLYILWCFLQTICAIQPTH